MKISVKTYARAFAEVATGKHSLETQKKMVRNFTELVRKNGDGRSLPKILESAEKMLREKEGLRKFTILTARPISEKMRKHLGSLAGEKDVLEERVDPKLIAGMRLVLNDERQYDASLARQLQKMFTG